jgi:hypothetical protein
MDYDMKRYGTEEFNQTMSEYMNVGDLRQLVHSSLKSSMVRGEKRTTLVITFSERMGPPPKSKEEKEYDRNRKRRENNDKRRRDGTTAGPPAQETHHSTALTSQGLRGGPEMKAVASAQTVTTTQPNPKPQPTPISRVERLLASAPKSSSKSDPSNSDWTVIPGRRTRKSLSHPPTTPTPSPPKVPPAIPTSNTFSPLSIPNVSKGLQAHFPDLGFYDQKECEILENILCSVYQAVLHEPPQLVPDHKQLKVPEHLYNDCADAFARFNGCSWIDYNKQTNRLTL